MAAFLSGEMKDTVQMNPAGAYGQLYRLCIIHSTTDCCSPGAFLFEEGTPKVVPQLGRKREYVAQGEQLRPGFERAH